MAIIEIPVTAAAAKKKQIDELINSQYVGMKSTRNSIFSILYSGTIEEAQAVLNEYGTDATTLFILGGANDDAINAASTANNVDLELSSPPFNYTLNENGTVTLSPKE